MIGLRIVLLLVLGSLSTGVTSQSACDQLGDVVIVLDSSKQVEQVTWDAMIRLVQELSYRLTISYEFTRVAVVVYGNSAREIFPFNRYFSSAEVAMAVGKLTYQPSQIANLTAALSFVETSVFLPQKGERPHAPNAAIFITASQPTVLREKVFLIASRLRRSGVRLFTVGIDGRVDRVELRAIATNPDDTHFFYVREPLKLASLTSKIAADVCRDLQLCTEAADLVFILDTSGSVKEEWTRSLRFARNLVDLLPVGKNNVRVAGVAFSNYAYRQFNFSTDYTPDGIKKLIDNVVYHDKNTNTSGALRLTRTQVFQKQFGNREGVRDVGVLITDGESTWETYNLPYEAWATHQAGIQMYSIGLGGLVNKAELRLIASDPDVAHVFEVDRAEDQINDAIILKWSDCDIDVTYCTKKIDLVFVLDQSGSIGEPNFNRMLNFVRTLIGVLDISAGTARVGVIIFGDDARIYFPLNKYELGEEAARAILDIKYGRGSTNSSGGLRLLRQQMFTPENGDRPDVPNFAVVITDGVSNNYTATVLEARALKEAGVTVLALGVGNPLWMRDTELRAMASTPRDLNALQVLDFESLDRVVQALQDATCNETNECLAAPCQNKGQCKNGTNQYSCRCPIDYAGKKCQYRCPSYYDIVIAIDASGSVGEANFYKMLDFLSDFIGDLPEPADPAKRTRVGILTYSDDVQIQQHLNRYNNLKMTQDTIYFPYTRGATNTAAAIKAMIEMFAEVHGDRPLVPNVGIVITDGKSRDRMATWKESVKARNQGIHMVVIGVTNSVSELEIEGIASGPGETNTFRVQRFDQLGTIRVPLLKMLCNDENECDANRCRNGATCRDGLGMYYCKCAPGFIGQYCEMRGEEKMDVALVLDSSGSVQRENFPRMVEFVQAVVNNLDVAPDKTRVAAITFGDDAVLQFPLDEYPTKYDVMHALALIPYRAGTTNMADALKVVRENLFNGRDGDRLEVPNYAIILTDGDPNDLDAAVREAVTSRIDGTRLLVVGIGVNGQRHLEYAAIASYPQKRTVMAVNRFSRLQTLVSNATEVLASNRDFCLDVDCGPGRCEPHYLSYSCSCPVPFTGKLCQRRCTRQIDLALVVDVSADAAKDFPLMLEFLRGIIDGLNFNYGATRVSFICFDRYVKTQFLLRDYVSQQEILEAITLPKRGSGTDISSALYTIRDTVFKQNAGDRMGVQNYVILMSDGQASYPPRVDIPDTVIFTIGIGNNVNRLVLNEVNAHASSENAPEFHRIQTEADVPKVLDLVLDALCT